MEPLPETIVEDIAAGAVPASAAAEARSYAVNKPLLIVGLIAATALTALDATIVSTALPTIVSVLHGLPLYSLVLSGFFLTSTTTVPLYGKLSDMYGRKPVFMAGAGMLIVGSALCGLAWDMPSLIVFRAMQGLGAGAVLPVSLTLIGDLFDIEERARMQGVFGSVWGVSSVIGPLVGGLIVQTIGWRWVFFINVPVGIIAGFLLFTNLREPRTHKRQRVDFLGAATLTVGVGLLLLGLQSGGRNGWLSTLTLLELSGAVVLLVVFGLIERRVAAPLLTLDLLTRPVIAIPCLVGILGGAVLVGFAAYLPPLVQGGWGGTPTEAGLMVAPLSIGWPLASAAAGRLLKRVGFKALAFGGSAIVLAGTLMMLLVFAPGVSSNRLLTYGVVIVATFVSGLGFGSSTTAMLIAVQNSVSWNERGIATASVQFFRNMGNTIGAALLGAVLTATLAPALIAPRTQELLQQVPPGLISSQGDPAFGPANALLNLDTRKALPPPVRDLLSDGLVSSLGWVFVAVALLAALAVVFAARFPVVTSDR